MKISITYNKSTLYIYAILDCRSNPQNIDYIL